MKEGNEQEPFAELDYRIIILSRYCGEFMPATERTANVRKTSEDIRIDLRPMADFTTNEIAAYLAMNGYEIGFEGDTPVWLMRKDDELELREHN